MQSESGSSYTYVFPALIFVGVLLWYLYGAVDRIGLETQEGEARVTGKQFAQGSTTYNQKIVAGRAWTETVQNPDQYIVNLELRGEPTGGAVTPELYQSLQEGERVRVKYIRTRFSGRLLVTDVRR